MTTHFPTLARLINASVLVIVLLSITSCQRFLDEIIDEIRKDKKELPEEIIINEPGLFPEGIEFDPVTDRYFVSSIIQGTIGIVDDEGNYEPFIEDEDFVSTIGIHIDDLRQRLLVCVADPFEGDLAALGIYDLRSGGRIAFTDLGNISGDPDAPHFANDVAIDLEGNAYVTDSFYPVIYKVDQDGNASVFLKDDTFQPSEGAFGLNGVDFHPMGFLIVAFAETGTLYKVPLDNPEKFSEIPVDVPLQGPDGLYFSRNKQTLIVVNNAGGAASANVIALESHDLWETSEVKDIYETGGVFPTTATQRGNAFYVLYAHLDEVSSGDISREEFEITKVDFE